MNMSEKQSAEMIKTEKQHQARSSSMSYVGSTTALAKLDDLYMDKENAAKVGTEKKPRKLSKILADDYLSSTNLP